MSPNGDPGQHRLGRLAALDDTSRVNTLFTKEA